MFDGDGNLINTRERIYLQDRNSGPGRGDCITCVTVICIPIYSVSIRCLVALLLSTLVCYSPTMFIVGCFFFVSYNFTFDSSIATAERIYFASTDVATAKVSLGECILSSYHVSVCGGHRYV